MIVDIVGYMGYFFWLKTSLSEVLHFGNENSV